VKLLGAAIGRMGAPVDQPQVFELGTVHASTLAPLLLWKTTVLSPGETYAPTSLRGRLVNRGWSLPSAAVVRGSKPLPAVCVAAAGGGGKEAPEPATTMVTAQLALRESSR
jgi:hypothetical protein